MPSHTAILPSIGLLLGAIWEMSVYTMNRHDLCMQRVIYNRISLFRADNGMSRKDLADKVGVNPQTIGFLERGDYKPSLELAMMLAGIFGVRLEMLFSFQPFPSVAHTLGHTGD